MKLLPSLFLVASAIVLAGCTTNTPAYSGKERFAQINRNNVYQSEAANDDIDHILLLRPSNQETIWNVYHR
jgi:hypothetical protein